MWHERIAQRHDIRITPPRRAKQRDISPRRIHPQRHAHEAAKSIIQGLRWHSNLALPIYLARIAHMRLRTHNLAYAYARSFILWHMSTPMYPCTPNQPGMVL